MHSPTFTFLEPGGLNADGGDTALPVTSLLPRVATVAADLRVRLAPDAVVGLIFRSEPRLVLAWLACLHAGLRPLVMQYPTKKQSRLYWRDSVTNTIERASLAAVLCDDHTASLGVADLVPVIVLPALDAIAPATENVPADILPDCFAILQLSSGTTGHRKAVEFRSDDLRRHVADFNAALALDPARDRIVSWLPLYHDMGYVACFVMPLILGVDVVMMDPMTWVADPALLFRAAERHACTVCYLPNFAFEVMARAEPRPMPSMRLWISCSEPVSPATSRRFLDRIGAPDDAFAPCYAMAENIFAVTLGTGIHTAEHEDREVISCGRPIPGVDLKLVEGEIHVRSPTSLRAYVGGDDIRDADGYYPTGDLGFLRDGELYITGRKGDLLVQAGRKFMLSDLDLAVNEAFPEVRGRVATVAVQDERLGTGKALVLIEAGDFFERRDAGTVAEEVRARAGLDQVEVAFVPPRFLTKTSSGKINRKKSAADYAATRAKPVEETTPGDRRAAVETEFRHSFGHLDWNAPVGRLLDSLSLTVLRIILGDAAIPYDAELSLNEFLSKAASDTQGGEDRDDTISIISLADSNTLQHVTPDHLERLSRRLGAPVTLEHMCLPPAPCLLSDLVFQDWFLPRAERTHYAVVERQLNKLRRASLIIVDDVAEMLFPPVQVYGVLSHAFERDPRADLLSVRWQRYPQMHQHLPLTVVSGADLPIADRSAAIQRLARYLDIPVFRMAMLPDVERFTTGWEYRASEVQPNRAQPRHHAHAGELVRQLVGFVSNLPRPLRRASSRPTTTFKADDLPHYCSWTVDADVIEVLVRAYDRFCIVGQESSLPRVAQRITDLGKTYVRAPSYAPEVLKPIEDEFDIILICGPQGRYEITKPAFALMTSDPKQHVWNISDPSITELKDRVLGPDMPPSGTDWYYPSRLVRDADRDVFETVRRNVRQFGQRRRARMLARLESMAGSDERPSRAE